MSDPLRRGAAFKMLRAQVIMAGATERINVNRRDIGEGPCPMPRHCGCPCFDPCTRMANGSITPPPLRPGETGRVV